MDKIFNDKPSLQECFKTADGQYFYAENTAKLHAKSLDDKTVEHLERPLVELSAADELAEKTVKELKAIAKEREIPYDGKPTKAQLIDIILNHAPVIEEDPETAGEENDEEDPEQAAAE
jgi:hypothetical protein